jgi:hypothetical protein
MESGRKERDDLLRQQIPIMSPEDFEQLVFELAQREDQTVVRLDRPDGGADTLRPASPPTRAGVWQAKRHKDRIDWRDCEKSLAKAIETWNPEHVTFAFPRDLTTTPQKSFQSKLTNHSAALRTGAIVGYWGLSELVRRLNEDDNLRVRFFGQSQELQIDQLNRTIAAGGRLESGADLIDRAKTLSEWADQQDKDFLHRIGTAPLMAPQPQWDQVPYMEMTIADTKTRLDLTSWVREGASVPAPVITFTTDATGEKARRHAVTELATGRPVTITNGVKVNLAAPKLIQKLVGPIEDLPGGQMVLHPGAPIPLQITLETGDRTFMSTVDLRPVPPPPERAAALAGYLGASLVTVTLQPLGNNRVSLELNMSGQFGNDARANRDGAAALLALRQHRTATLKSATLFPGAEVSGSMTPERPALDSEVVELELLHDVFDSIVTLSDHGHELKLPPAVTAEDADVLITLRDILRTGKGTATMHPVERMVAATEIASIAKRMSGTTFTRPVVFPLFGVEISLGMAEYAVPSLQLADIKPHGTTPNAPARVILKPTEDMEFTLA